MLRFVFRVTESLELKQWWADRFINVAVGPSKVSFVLSLPPIGRPAKVRRAELNLSVRQGLIVLMN